MRRSGERERPPTAPCSRNPSESLKIWRHLNSEYGPLVRLDIPGREPTVLVFDPRVAEQVYRQEGPLPARPAFYSLRAAKERDEEPAGLQGMLASNGESWRAARNCAQVGSSQHTPLVMDQFQAQLLQPNLARRFLPKICDLSEQFATHLADSLQTGQPGTVDKFEAEVYKWALESIASIALNKTLGCISSTPDQKSLQMIQAVSEILHYSKKLDAGLRLWETFPSKDFDYFCETYRAFKRLAHSHIEDSLEEDQESESLVRDLRLAGHSAEMITSVATELLFGGVDTTSHSVIFSLYLLANNRSQQETLRQELDSLEPGDWPDHLLGLPYLNSVIKESMRMLPTSPANIRYIVSLATTK